MLTVIVAYSWGGFPFVMLLILARMQGLPEEINEAAKIDGANWWQIFRYITLPSLTGVLMIAAILEIVSGINSFDTLVIMTGGGPANATMIWGIEIYKTGFTEFNLGGAAALSVLMFLGMLTVFMMYGACERPGRPAAGGSGMTGAGAPPIDGSAALRDQLLASSLLRAIGRHALVYGFGLAFVLFSMLAAALGRQHGAQAFGRRLCLSADLDPEQRHLREFHRRLPQPFR